MQKNGYRLWLRVMTLLPTKQLQTLHKQLRWVLADSTATLLAAMQELQPVLPVCCTPGILHQYIH